MAAFSSVLSQAQYLSQPLMTPKMDPSFKIDEGYSEDARSQDDPDSPMKMESSVADIFSSPWAMGGSIPEQILALSESDRSEFVYRVLRTLRTSSIAAIVDRLRPLLHIDPVAVLPPEITSEMFSYLSPTTLLEASRVSRAWRERALDSRLWRLKFRSEGWGLDMEAVRRFEQSTKRTRKTRSRRAETHAEQRRQKRRARTGVDFSDNISPHRRINLIGQQNMRNWRNQQGDVEADEEKILVKQESINDEEMQDVDSHQSDGSPSPIEIHSAAQSDVFAVQHLNEAAGIEEQHLNSDPKFEAAALWPSISEPSIVRYTSNGVPQVNYTYVYKQKRRLEENWDSGQYQSFQLPHRDHPEEAHRECVYTIQYIGKYLVSGSRDRTLRKWDLDTQRLIGKPLIGHTASVLCLQFDNSPSEDIIISGSSDTDVILWRYSTGEMIKKIPHAHEESVLNLKFDSRFLVTCSKDKTIKIWNRHELRPGDRDYPVKGVEGGGFCPSYIIDLRHFETSVDMDRYLTPEEKAPLEPYTPLMILGAHNAAVNAIHIYEDQLVSASGDRHVHVWDIHTGVRTAICRGHSKGIACVQYDGKRIVSGSSDNTIRIYDPATQAEVACLKGHSRLVRTIQFAFGDLPGKREQLEAEALEIDGKFHEARRLGDFPSLCTRTMERNAGSKDPKYITAYGAKLPPGGGGSKWGRIVSGSYDETIIIWKKLADGRWTKAHVLHQEEALRAAGGPLMSQSDLNNQANNGQAPPLPPPPPQQHQLHTQPGHASTQQNAQIQNTSHLQSTLSSAQAGHSSNYSANTTFAPTQPQNQASTSAHQATTNVLHRGSDATQQPALTHIPLHQQHQLVGAIAAAQNAAQDIQSLNPQSLLNHSNAQSQQQQQPQPVQPQPHGAHPVAHRYAAPVLQPNARVFKLQFDARRIICCSQDPKIVGWDFANGDEQIMECSPFFSTPL
ncbi:MAG: hypothetical protein LQ351_001846 [Letrouitia transgressa]|nr:MAG: hypothetical protein LQ351_001846 [Letrouitia transgressa]